MLVRVPVLPLPEMSRVVPAVELDHVVSWPLNPQYPTKPLVIIGVVGTAVLMTMDPKQVEVLERRLAQVRGMLRDKALVEKSTPPTVGQ
jgi:hypothetical protein